MTHTSGTRGRSANDSLYVLLRGSIGVQSIHRFEGRVHAELEPLDPVGRAYGRRDLAGQTAGRLELGQRVNGSLGGLQGYSFLELPEL